MCYYVASSFSVEDIIQLEHDFVLQWAETESSVNYCVSGFSHPELPVATAEKFLKMKWGLIPHWIPGKEQANKIKIQTLNAQAEGISSKPSFRSAFKSQQCCIVPINGFFEWHHHSNGQKYPFFIYPKSGRYFFVAGLYDSWQDPESAKPIQTFSIITTPANSRMAWIHNSKKRMPAILPLTQARQWLDPILPVAEKQKLLKPCEDHSMLDHSVSRLISSRRENINQVSVLDRHYYPDLESDFPEDLFHNTER